MNAYCWVDLISRLRGFTKFGGNTSYRLVKRGPASVRRGTLGNITSRNLPHVIIYTFYINIFTWRSASTHIRVNNKFIVWSHSWEGHGLWTCYPDVRNTRAQLSKWPVDLMSGMTWTSPGAYVWMAVTYSCLLYGALFSATMEYLARTGFKIKT